MDRKSVRLHWGSLAAVVVFILAPGPAPAAPLKSVLIRDVPFVRQKPDFCGEACAEMYLRKLKVAVDQDYVFDQSGLDPVLGRGCYTLDLANALKQIGFRTGGIWSDIPVRTSREKLDEEFAALHADLAAGIPSIVCTRYDERPETTEHFRLVLVHEIVHPFIASNFPECPAWFNEGLASLYEQASERDGHIIGLTNWRLAGLQKALRNGKVPSFETLCGTTTHEFYDRDSGPNYAQARYLCYYLQERGLLTKYFHTFRNNSATDTTGYETLLSVLDEDDGSAFRKRWEEFVLDQRFLD